MFKLLIILFFITFSLPMINCGEQTEAYNFISKLQQKHIQKAADFLENTTNTPQTLYDINMELLNHEGALIKLMFFEKIYSKHYKWYQALDIKRITKLYQTLENDKQLIVFPKIREILNDIEFSIIHKASVQFKNCVIFKKSSEFNNLTEDLSTLPLSILTRCIKLSVSTTYGLIIHSKLLKRLGLEMNLNKTKIIYFIEFFKELKKQNALTLNLIYKLALSLKHILVSYNFQNDRILNHLLINVKQSLPADIQILIFSTSLCIRSQNTNLYLSSSRTDNTFRLSPQLNDSSMWQTYIFEQKLILESKSSAIEIFVNYNHNLNDNFNDYHLKPVTNDSYKLQNSLINQILCLRNSTLIWQNNTLELQKNNNSNCLWSINNCTTLKRFLSHEYN